MTARPLSMRPCLCFLATLALFAGWVVSVPQETKGGQEAPGPLRAQHSTEKEPAALKAQLARAEAEKGNDHPDLIPILLGIAQAYREQGGYIPASQFAQRALAIAEKVHGSDDLQVAGVLDLLGTLYRLQGDSRRAQEYYERALPIVQKRLGSGHPAYAIMLNNLAKAYISTRKTEEAESTLHKAMQIVVDTFGPASAQATIIQETLGDLYLTTRKYSAAEQQLRYALTVRSEALVFGESRKDALFHMAPIQNLLGALYTAFGLYDKAEPLLYDALKAYEANLDKEHTLLEGVLVNLAVLFDAEGKTTEAAAYRKRAEYIHEKNIGFSHSSTSPLPMQTKAVPAPPEKVKVKDADQPFANARVGDWVVYEGSEGALLQKKEIVRKTDVGVVVLTYMWIPETKEWHRGLEEIISFSAGINDLYGVSVTDLKPEKVAIRRTEITCGSAVVSEEGTECKICFAPDMIPVGGMVTLECGGKVILKAVDYQRAN